MLNKRWYSSCSGFKVTGRNFVSLTGIRRDLDKCYSRRKFEEICVIQNDSGAW